MTCNNIFVSLKKIIPPVDQSLCTCSQLINRILIYNFRHSHTKILKKNSNKNPLYCFKAWEFIRCVYSLIGLYDERNITNLPFRPSPRRHTKSPRNYKIMS